ncbi:MAG: ZIP family metal transporter [Elusimicrobia bacterium]|nr:ZIP family metal transporter [Elusimicrobiota bacterium]
MLATPAILGLLAGGAIFAGLPIAFASGVKERHRSLLTSISTGILIYLFVEICAKTLDELEDLLASSMADYPTWGDFWLYSFLFIAGLAAGLLGLVYFEGRFIKQGKDEILPMMRARRTALFIAIGIGLHNLTEGLVIGAQYAWGEQNFALLLALGFGLHNATEGFGIAAPMAGHSPGFRYLMGLGLIGGLPTFIGALLGGVWVNKMLETFFMAVAAGAILYIIGELLHLGRRLKGEALVEVGLLIGFVAAFATEMMIVSQGGSL